MSEWQPIETAPENRKWWVLWDETRRQPVVSFCRNVDGEFFEGDWDRRIEAAYWLTTEPPQ